MSKIALQGNASGTGTLTIAAPNTNTDRTLTLPDATGTVNTSGLANEVPAGSAGAPAIYPTGDTNTGVFFPAADTVAVATGGAERVRVDSSGFVGIGTTSPASLFDIRGSSNGQNVLQLSNSAGTNDGGAENQIRVTCNGNTNWGNLDVQAYTTIFTTNGTERARITSAGIFHSPPTYSNTSGGAANVGIAADGAFYRSTSSLRYKNSVQDASHGLAELMTLRPVTYKGNNDGDTVFGGLIAEEVHEAGLTEFVQYAEDGSPDALAYSNMVSLCIKAIQEQQALITALTARVAELEAK